MKSEHSEHEEAWLDAAIRSAVGSAGEPFDAKQWTRKYHCDLAALRHPPHPQAIALSNRSAIWRFVMKHPKPMAASAALAAGIIIAAALFVMIGNPSVSIAQVIEQLRTQCYQFQMHVTTTDQSNPSAPATIRLTAQAMVMQPGKIRMEMNVGSNKIIGIFDQHAAKSLTLIESAKVAYLSGEQNPDKMLDFMLDQTRPLEDLWGLKADEAISLDAKTPDGRNIDLNTLSDAGIVIDNKSAKGFRTTRIDGDIKRTIDVWADAKTGHPLAVFIRWNPPSSNNPVNNPEVNLVLSDFKVVDKPDAKLFSTDVPNGYTLANHQTLKQAMEHAGAQVITEQAQAVLKAMLLWSTDRKDAAVNQLLAVNWNAEFRFTAEAHLFTMTEKQFVSLQPPDKMAVMTQVTDWSSLCREMAKALAERGRNAKTTDQAETCFNTIVQFGGLLCANSELMLITRLNGYAVQQQGLQELATLYERQNDSAKLQHVQKQREQIEKEVNQISRTMTGE